MYATGVFLYFKFSLLQSPYNVPVNGVYSIIHCGPAVIYKTWGLLYLDGNNGVRCMSFYTLMD